MGSLYDYYCRGVQASDPDSLPAPPAYHSPPPPYQAPVSSPARHDEESSSDDEEIKYRDDDYQPSKWL